MSNANAVFVTKQVNVETCCTCGCVFGIDDTIQKRRRDDHDWFYCTFGHAQRYTGETEATKLKRELEAANAAKSREWQRANAEAARAEKAERKLRRVSKGTCPECKRSFVDLARHMKTKHDGCKR